MTHSARREPLRRVELSWDPKMGKKLGNDLEEIARDLTQVENLTEPMRLHPHGVVTSNPFSWADEARFAILVGETAYTNITNWGNRRLAVVTTDVQLRVHLGMMATSGQEMGRWDGLPAVALRVPLGRTASFLALVGPGGSIQRVVTYGVRPDNTLSVGMENDTHGEEEITVKNATQNVRLVAVEPPDWQ